MFQYQALHIGQRSENFAENVFKELHQQASRALFYSALAVRLFELQTQCGLNDDAEGQSQSRAPEASHRSRQPIWQSFRNPTDPALLEIERRGLSATRSRATVMTGLRESQLACRASRCSESSALSAAFKERRTASNTASGEISSMHLRPVRHTPL